MPEVVFCILMAYCRIGRPYPDRHEVAEYAGYEFKSVERVEPAIVRAGFLSSGQGRGMRHTLTDKGKIALAIEVGRRSRGNPAPMTEREFQRRYGSPCLRRST